MQIINLEQKLQKKLNNFNKTEPYTFFFINHGRPSEISCKLIPFENDTIFINIVHEQHKEWAHKTCNNINISYTVLSDECDAPVEIHAISAFYTNERIVTATDDLVKTMTEMVQEIFDVVEQDN